MQPDSDSGDESGVLARLAQLDADELDALVELAQQRANGSISRRGMLQAGAAIGGGALLGGGAVGSASAQASTSDSDPNVGTPSTPVDVFAEGVDANSVNTDSATINSGTGVGIPATSSNVPYALGDGWRQPSADRPVLVTSEVGAETDGTNRGDVTLEVDESGGTSRDYAPIVAWAPAGLGSESQIRQTVTFLLPSGAQYQLVSGTDPNNGNFVDDTREFVL